MIWQLGSIIHIDFLYDRVLEALQYITFFHFITQSRIVSSEIKEDKPPSTVDD